MIPLRIAVVCGVALASGANADRGASSIARVRGPRLVPAPSRDAVRLAVRPQLRDGSLLLALRGGGPSIVGEAWGKLTARVLRPLALKMSSTFKRLDPRARVIVIFVLGLTAGALVSSSAESFEIFNTVDDVPGKYFRQQREIPCVVVTVTDGDTMRVMHTPLLSGPRRAIAERVRPRAGKHGPKLSESTMQVRLAAIDTPEVAKFGKPAQPFGNEAKAYVQKRLLGRRIRVKLLSRDQYGRAVASVKYQRGLAPLRSDLGEDLLSDGLAVVYRQGGAQYDSADGVQKWNRIEARAKAQGRGVWAGGKGGGALELPSEYKARMRARATAVVGRT